jgi:transposase
MTDAEWALIARGLRRGAGWPSARSGFAQGLTILYILSTGCQWRALPKDFPPYSTVQGYFYARRDTGRWQKIVTTLVRQARRKLAQAQAEAVIDSQSGPTTQAGGPRGYDAVKRIYGRKKGTSSPTPMACCSLSTFIPPTFGTAMAPFHCWNRYDTGSPSCRRKPNPPSLTPPRKSCIFCETTAA